MAYCDKGSNKGMLWWLIGALNSGSVGGGKVGLFWRHILKDTLRTKQAKERKEVFQGLM